MRSLNHHQTSSIPRWCVDWSIAQWPYRAMSDRLKLARDIAARTKPRFIEIPRERGGVRVPFTEEQLTAIRGGLTAEEYRWKLIRKWRDQDVP